MADKNTPRSRQTKYYHAIKELLSINDHATNKELLIDLRKVFPHLSATTVHRATARLAQRGEIGIAPTRKDGSVRYDATADPHDHFHCQSCDIVRDTAIKHKIIPILESSIADCRITGRLTVTGLCKNCNYTK